MSADQGFRLSLLLSNDLYPSGRLLAIMKVRSFANLLALMTDLLFPSHQASHGPVDCSSKYQSSQVQEQSGIRF